MRCRLACCLARCLACCLAPGFQQLPAYLSANPALHGRYKRWLLTLSTPRQREESGEGSDDDRGGGGSAGGAVGAGACASASAATEGETRDGAATGDDAGAGAAAVRATAVASSPPATTAPCSYARRGATDGSTEEQRGRDQAERPDSFEQEPSSGTTTSTPDPNAAPTALSPSSLPSRGVSSDVDLGGSSRGSRSGGGSGGGGGGSSGGDSSTGGGGAKDVCPALTPPLAFRTRSRGRRCSVAVSSPTPSLSETTPRRHGASGGGGPRGRRGVRGSGHTAVDWEGEPQKTPRSGKGKGRRKTLLVMGGGPGGVAGRLVGSGRRAGAAAKR